MTECLLVIFCTRDLHGVGGNGDSAGPVGSPRGWIRKLRGDPQCRGYSDRAPRGAGASGKHVVLPVVSLKLNFLALNTASACWCCNPITGLNCSSWQALTRDMLSTSA